MTGALRAYLATYATWIDGGATQFGPFSRRYGLCGNARLFASDYHLICNDLNAALAADFPENPAYPFGEESLYGREFRDYTAHLNKDRIAWLRGKL